jgi:CheY-like chemotaxis protein
VLLDLNMPVMTGWEFRDQQRKDPKLAEIPVAVISADRSLEHPANSISALDYFRKPIDLERLLSVLENVCP